MTSGHRAERYARHVRAIAIALVALALTPLARSEEVVQNPRICSPSGEFCVVLRHYPRIGDFDRVPAEEYWRADPIEAWLEEYPVEPPAPPPPPEPGRAAVYRRWPSGNQELLYELTHDSHKFLIADDGFYVSYRPVPCDKKEELLTIHSPDGSSVRTLRVQDVFTRNDQLWLCRGREDDVRWSFDATLRATVLVTDTKWDDPESRFATVEIDPANDHLPAPTHDLCPDVVRIEAEPDALLPPAIHRPTPEYPEVAFKARVSGTVRARLVIGRDGTVQSVTITKPVPFGIDEAVRIALLQWTFDPRQEPLTGEIAFRFEILRDRVIETIVCFRRPPPESGRNCRPRADARLAPRSGGRIVAGGASAASNPWWRRHGSCAASAAPECDSYTTRLRKLKAESGFRRDPEIRCR